ncbi:MAG: hypothetical protein ACK5P7_00730 [Bdellovibrio sp.]
MKRSLLIIALAFSGLGATAEAQGRGCIVTPQNNCLGFDQMRPGRPGPGRPPGPPAPPRPPGPPMPPPPGRPMPPPPVVGERTVQKVVYLNRAVRNERFSLNDLLSPMDQRELDGAELELVTIDAYEQNRRGALSLVINGWAEDLQDNVYGQTVLRPNRYLRLDRHVRVDIEAQGRLYINSIVIQARVRGGGHGPGPGQPGSGQFQVNMPVHRAISNERFFLIRDLNLGQYHGATVVDVIVQARALNPQQLATIALLVNGQVIGGMNPDFANRPYAIRLTGARTIGRDLQSLQLDASQVIIENITVRLLR